MNKQLISSPFAPEIAYVLKGFGRTSETFISNEIFLLESLGARLQLFSIKKLEGQRPHGVVSRIQSPVVFLPDASPVNETNFLFWLLLTLPGFFGAHLYLFLSRPALYLRVLLESLAYCVRLRSKPWIPKKVFFKEFIQAGYIAREVLRRPSIRHLHAHFCHGATTVTMFASRLAGVPFSFTAHAKDIYLEELNPRDLLDIKMRRAEFVVTCTEANLQHLNQRDSGTTPVHAIYHGLDLSLFTPPKEPAAASIPLLLSVGRIVEKKGFDYLIRACHLLRRKGCVFKCLIVGGADKHSEVIKTLIRDLELEDIVEMRSSVTQEELKQIYQQATVFALPCLIGDNGDRDGIPNVLVEAMAMQLPVVSTSISGIPELVQSGVNGLLVASRNEVRLAEAIQALFDNPGLRERLGRAARARVLESFDSSRNTQFLNALFDARLRAAMPARERRATEPVREKAESGVRIR